MPYRDICDCCLTSAVRLPADTGKAEGITESAILKSEFERLRNRIGKGFDLNLVWKPDPESKLEGEVKNDIIYIYSTTLEKATETLAHELAEWLATQPLKPYQDMINVHRVMLNSVLKYLEEKAYASKEEAIEALVNLLRKQQEKR